MGEHEDGLLAPHTAHEVEVVLSPRLVHEERQRLEPRVESHLDGGPRLHDDDAPLGLELIPELVVGQARIGVETRVIERFDP